MARKYCQLDFRRYLQEASGGITGSFQGDNRKFTVFSDEAGELYFVFAGDEGIGEPHQNVCRPANARVSVASSMNSRSVPMGMPCAIRVTSTPMGCTSLLI